MGREGFGWVGRVCCLSKASKRMCLHRTNFIKNENRNHDCLLARVLDLDYRKVASANHTSYPTGTCAYAWKVYKCQHHEYVVSLWL